MPSEVAARPAAKVRRLLARRKAQRSERGQQRRLTRVERRHPVAAVELKPPREGLELAEAQLRLPGRVL